MGKVDATFLQFHGDLGDMSFFTREGKMFYRKKSNLNKERVSKDAAFARSRESSNEFGNSSKFAKLLFDVSAQISKGIRDPRAYNRLMEIANKLKDLDLVSPHGSRSPLIGISHPDAEKLLLKFKFNINSSVQSVLYRPFDIRSNRMLIIHDFNPKTDLQHPKTATHFSFLAERVDIDLTTGAYVISWSNTYEGCLCDPPKDLCLSFDSTIASDVLQIFYVRCSFFESLNGKFYELNGKSGNFCGIMGVVRPVLG